MVSAIHGRLLTAWATAGVLGPVLVNYIRDYQIEHGSRHAEAYSFTMYVLAGLLAVGFVCNLMIQPVLKKHYMSRAQIAEIDAANKPAAGSRADATVAAPEGVSPTWLVVAAWLAVGVPIAWGAWITILKAAAIFVQG
jgi:hypothetical protein